jgi:signal transduction histidine kinase
VVHGLCGLDPRLQVEVGAEVPVVYHGDAELLRRVIENLVSNAIKHTPRDGRLRVDVASTPACVRIAVRDEGPGVPPNARERIFERFSATGLSTESGRHSVGLGLAFCKYAVEAHGGTIRVESAQPRGSTFIVELPWSTPIIPRASR